MMSSLLLKRACATTWRPGFFLQSKKNKLSSSLIDISSTTSCLHHRRSLSTPPTYYIPSHVKNRRRRSVHFIPADNDKFLSKSLTLGADTIVLDLEDSVKDKQLGREKLHSFLEKANDMSGRENTEVLVRI